jgi:hypothetical protein
MSTFPGSESIADRLFNLVTKPGSSIPCPAKGGLVMAKFRCETCGQEHGTLPLDLAYERPADFFRLPEEERERRIVYNADLCSIDRKEHYARGILALPIQGGNQEFRWGVWARIPGKNLKRYLDLWNADAAADEPAFPGRLSGGIQVYPNTDGLAVEVKLQVRKRPRFFVVDPVHPLGIAQREGVTWEEVHRFVGLAMGPG